MPSNSLHLGKSPNGTKNRYTNSKNPNGIKVYKNIFSANPWLLLSLVSISLGCIIREEKQEQNNDVQNDPVCTLQAFCLFVVVFNQTQHVTVS